MKPVTHRYGPDKAQFGELSQPDGPSRGTVVILHGGFWRARYDLSLGVWAAGRAGVPAGAPGAEPRVAVTGVVSQAGVLTLADCAREGVGGTAAPTELSGDHFTLIDPAAPDWAAVTGALPGLLS